MTARSATSAQPTSTASSSSTRSRASASGTTRSGSRASQTTFPFGQEAAPASRSARRGRKAASRTTGTSGQHGSTSSRSADLQSSLESRLRARTASLGSTLFRLTWKHAVTPSRRRFCLLRASVLRICATARTSWPPPTASLADKGVRSEEGAIREAMRNHGPDLAAVAALAGWPTTTAQDGSGARRHGYMVKGHPGTTLTDAANLAGWVTPAARDWKDTPGMATEREDGRSRLDQLPRQAQLTASGGGADWLYCRDQKLRPVEPGTFPLAHGAPARVGRLRAYGNAINAWQAAVFLSAAFDAMEAA
jgi:hypothetical protein